MALRLDDGTDTPAAVKRFVHVCDLPWPKDPSLSEGHLCECGRRWSYQPAHWEPLFTIEEMRERQHGGEYGRSCLNRTFGR